MLAFAYIALILFLALVIESLVEAVIGEPLSTIGNQTLLKWKPYILRYIAMAVGVGLSFHYTLDLVSLTWQLLAEQLQLSLPAISASPIGYVLTGLGIGRGASWLHQLLKTVLPNLGNRLGGT